MMSASRRIERRGALRVTFDGQDRHVWPCKIDGCAHYADPTFDVTLLCGHHAMMVPQAMWDALDNAPNMHAFAAASDAIVEYAQQCAEIIDA